MYKKQDILKQRFYLSYTPYIDKNSKEVALSGRYNIWRKNEAGGFKLPGPDRDYIWIEVYVKYNGKTEWILAENVLEEDGLKEDDIFNSLLGVLDYLAGRKNSTDSMEGVLINEGFIGCKVTERKKHAAPPASIPKRDLINMALMNIHTAYRLNSREIAKENWQRFNLSKDEVIAFLNDKDGSIMHIDDKDGQAPPTDAQKAEIKQEYWEILEHFNLI